MQRDEIYSDQLYNWSAHERFDRCATPSPPGSGQTARATPVAHSSGVAHRTLQTLRPSGLQVSTGPRARAQVLPIGQPSRRRPTRNGLRPPGVFPAGLRLLAELPESAPGARTDLQSQPRVVKTSSEVLICNAHGAFSFISAGPRLGWDPCRQFFAGLVASWMCLARPNRQPINLA